MMCFILEFHLTKMQAQVHSASFSVYYVANLSHVELHVPSCPRPTMFPLSSIVL